MGSQIAGIYSIGLAIAQLMWTIGVFEATTYFATDTGQRFSSEQYLGFKVLSCVAMVVISIGYVGSFHYDSYKTAIVLSLCAFNLSDAFGLYYFAAFQNAGRLDISGYSSVMQTLFAVIAFAGTIIISHNLIAAIILATIGKTAWILIYNNIRLMQVAPIGHINFDRSAMKGLFVELLPLFVSSFLANYLANIPKYAIDTAGTSTMQAQFSILFMPSFVINLFLIFVMRPLLTPMATMCTQGNIEGFRKITTKIVASIFAATLVVLVGSYFIGIPILQGIFALDLQGCLSALLITMLGGGIAALSTVFYNNIIILRRQRLVLLVYGASLAVTVLVASPLVAAWGLLGASICYAISSACLLIGFALVFWFAMKDRAAEISR